MTKMLIIAKATLILFGIYIISTILYICESYSRFSHNVWISSVKYSLVIIFGFVIYQLLIKGDKWAHYLIGRQELKNTGELPSFALTVYRITVVLCGILIAYYAVPKTVTAVIALFDPSQFEEHKMYDDFFYATGRILIAQWTVVIKIVFGIYLLCGAPRFVRRQVEETLSYINKKTDNMPHYEKNTRKED